MTSQSINDNKLAREVSFNFLYHLSLEPFQKKRESIIEQIDEYTSHQLENDLKIFEILTEHSYNKNNIKNVLDYAQKLALGVLKNEAKIEDLKYKNMKIPHKKSPSKITNILLAQGIYEMAILKSIPPAVAINEYINLAKRYAEKTAPPFINALLDNMAKNDFN